MCACRAWPRPSAGHGDMRRIHPSTPPRRHGRSRTDQTPGVGTVWMRMKRDPTSGQDASGRSLDGVSDGDGRARLHGAWPDQDGITDGRLVGGHRVHMRDRPAHACIRLRKCAECTCICAYPHVTRHGARLRRKATTHHSGRRPEPAVFGRLPPPHAGMPPMIAVARDLGSSDVPRYGVDGRC